jgi:hypothetical protein
MSIVRVLPSKDVHCLIKQEKTFVPRKISWRGGGGLQDLAPTTTPSKNPILGFFGWDETQLNLKIGFWVHNFYFFTP